MRLYDALWSLAAADLKANLENKEFLNMVAATSKLKKPATSPEGAARAAASQEWKAPNVEKPSK
jgi:hypothetical protein